MQTPKTKKLSSRRYQSRKWYQSYLEKDRIIEIILDIVNKVKISFKEGVSIETRLGDKIGGGRSGSIHDNNDNNSEIEIYADKSRITQAMLSS
ncbi:MAG: hypothetical protein WA220_07305 [Candidatus Nitrosopolaris sp.]